MIRSDRRRHAPLRATSSLSLRWRVMLLAMSMVAMVVVLMAFAVYAVISAALYSDIDNQLQSRAQLLIASGSLAADPGKAIEGTAYSDVNAMLVNPGHSIYTAQQPGQTLPVGSPEKAVIRGDAPFVSSDLALTGCRATQVRPPMEHLCPSRRFVMF